MSAPYLPYVPPQPLRAPEGTSPSTVHFWLIVAIFGIQFIPAYAYLATFDMSAFVTPGPSGLMDAYAMMFTPAYFAIWVVSLLAYAGTGVLAYLDSKELRARGVASPFHWATSLVPSYGTYIYVIGRAVVVYRRTGGGLAPLWVFVAINVASVVMSVVVMLMMMNSMFASLPLVDR